tara:strand:- start:245651 stop:246355 length:705 start_codon:yes stop_codon:yes gene_type:complete
MHRAEPPTIPPLSKERELKLAKQFSHYRQNFRVALKVGKQIFSQNLREALWWFEQMLRAFPHHIKNREFVWEVADIYRLHEQYDKASEYIVNIVATSAREKFIKASICSNNPATAEAALELCYQLKMEGEYASKYQLLVAFVEATSYYELSDYIRARGLIDNALRLIVDASNSLRLDFLYLRAWTYLKQGNMPSARIDCVEIKRQSPGGHYSSDFRQHLNTTLLPHDLKQLLTT